MSLAGQARVREVSQAEQKGKAHVGRPWLAGRNSRPEEKEGGAGEGN